ncbi:hypothetical protein A11A3_03984 [Alcanivorax hongdengensis A-11-3]|uniref:Imelysin-like domain-containing protein n=1 Tax=Alcanivorax hongdengensis A-11-3 TaxID=1177179 RepID=L0WH89_9GAMM|nr:imelysin family protein [Alcanivorax hongdengensis]EKF75487.1 hypothetical protein A11A3_03984 [Alcanivorax hongdengensis A-11-3]
MRFFPVLLLALTLVACDNNSPPPAQPDSPPTATPRAIKTDAWQKAGDQRLADAANHWQSAMAAFQAGPDQARLDSLRQAARQWYASVSQAYLLLASRACASEQQDRLDRVDSWPLYPGYLDALPQWPDSGLINDPTLALTADSLRNQHGATDDGEASLGFAALFVVLEGPGDDLKPLKAYTGKADSPDRRRQYLALVGTQLQQDIQALDVRPLTDRNLACGLQRTLDQHHRLQQWQNNHDNDENLAVPAATVAIQGKQLINTVSTLPDAIVNQWQQTRPGLADAIKASDAEDWSALDDWLNPPVDSD